MLHRHGDSNGLIGGVGPNGTGSELERFETLTLPHLVPVFRLARTLASTHEEAEDLVQETFVRAFQAFRSFELREYGAKPWLFRILYNTFYTLRTKRRREPGLLDESDLEHVGAEPDGPQASWTNVAQLNWDQFDDEVKKAVDRLQPEYRTVLLLWSIEGLTYKEIADVCGCALGTVMSRLYRARRLLASWLVDYARDRKWSMDRFS